MKLLVLLIYIIGFFFVIGTTINCIKIWKKTRMSRRLNNYMEKVLDLYWIYKNFEDILQLKEFDFVPLGSKLVIGAKQISIVTDGAKGFRRALSDICVKLLEEESKIYEFFPDQEIHEKGIELINEVKIGVRVEMIKNNESYE